MDREKIRELRDLLEELIGENEPSDKDLDFDEEAIEMYAAMHNLLESIKEYGL